MRLESDVTGQVNENASRNASEDPLQQELALYQCGPGGPVVNTPKDCWDIDRKNRPDADTLPPLQLVS